MQVRQNGSIGKRGKIEDECVLGEGAQVGDRVRFDIKTRVNDHVQIGNGVKLGRHIYIWRRSSKTTCSSEGRASWTQTA